MSRLSKKRDSNESLNSSGFESEGSSSIESTPNGFKQPKSVKNCLKSGQKLTEQAIGSVPFSLREKGNLDKLTFATMVILERKDQEPVTSWYTYSTENTEGLIHVKPDEIEKINLCKMKVNFQLESKENEQRKVEFDWEKFTKTHQDEYKSHERSTEKALKCRNFQYWVNKAALIMLVGCFSAFITGYVAY